MDFTGGEPLLRSDVGQIYAEAKKGFYTSMTTNTILYPKSAGNSGVGGLLEFLAGWWRCQLMTSRG